MTPEELAALADETTVEFLDELRRRQVEADVDLETLPAATVAEVLEDR